MRKIELNNGHLPIEDKELYLRMQGNFVSCKEKEFFEEMICKELYDFPCSTFDVIVPEEYNAERLFIQKMYNSEYQLGGYSDKDTYNTMDYIPCSLSELLNISLSPLLGRNVTVLEWLREKNYECVRYDYPWEE